MFYSGLIISNKTKRQDNYFHGIHTQERHIGVPENLHAEVILFCSSDFGMYFMCAQ